jgi:hypothetical protein
VTDRPSIDRWQSKLNRYLELADQYADAKAELSNLDNVKHTVIAMAAKASGEGSVAAQQREAYASEQYQQWTRDHYAAVKQCEGLRLRMRAAELWFDLVRSVESTRREEMRLAR